MPSSNEQDTQRFDLIGLDLARPVDSIKPGHYAFLQNVRSYTPGVIESRLGLTDLGEVVSGQTNVHSIRRLNDPLNSTWTRVIGTGTHLAYGQSTTFTDIDSGYSGDPLALMPYRPDQSPTAFMYVADRSRMRKLSRAGSLQPIGLAPPTSPPTINLSTAPSYKTVSDFNAAADWTQGGDAAAPSDQVRVATTVAQILYDTGSTGWACVNPTSFANIGPGATLVFDTGGGDQETVYVQETHPGSVATTIANVIYDSGSTGLCSIVLTTPLKQVEVNGLFRRTSGTAESTRVLSVTTGPDGNISFRVSTTNTFAVGDTVQMLISFRAYLANTHAAAETIDAAFVRTAITFSTGLATLTDTIALDLSLIATALAAHPEDYMHISFRVDRPDRVTELKAELDVDLSTNDFTRNYFSRSTRASDLTPSVRNAQPLISTRQTVLQRTIIDTPLDISQFNVDPVALQNAAIAMFGGEAVGMDFASLDVQTQITLLESIGVDTSAYYTDATANIDTTVPEYDTAVSQQMGLGDSQWSEIKFKLSDLLRVGTDTSRTLQNVAAIRITALITGNVTLDLDSWWIGGGYGPDILAPTGTPYLYRYRALVPTTGVRSNWSPATRAGVLPQRQSISVTLTQYAAPSGSSLTTSDILLEVQRYGGEIASWHYAGTVANAATPSFTDTYLDDLIANNPSDLQTHFQPWPIIDIPRTGTTAASGVSGTTVDDVGTNFNTSWAPGTIIKINGIAYKIYRVISTSRLTLVENAGSQSSVAWQIDEPVLLGQPLACLWGDEQFGGAFACGDTTNPGRLYYTNPYDPDSTIERNYLDITSPSEPLMNGLIWNGRSYVYSSERLFQIFQTDDPAVPYRVEELPGSGGLFSRWALTRNPHATFMGTLVRDGINRNLGGAGESLTNEDLYPLFPNEGNNGTTTNTLIAPNIVNAQAGSLRIEHYDDYLYFDYINTSSERRTLVYNQTTGGWLYDVYTPVIGCHYGEEGQGVHALLCGSSSDGHLYQYTGTSDDGTAIDCVVDTPSRDQGAPRLNKYYTDSLLDLNAAGVTVTITPKLNNQSSSLAAVTTAGSSRAQVSIALGSTAQTALNLMLRITFSVSSSSRPLLYIWAPRWTPETAPMSSRRWSVSPAHYGMPNYKHVGPSKITHVSSADLSFVITIDGVAQSAITIAHSSSLYSETYLRVPVMKGKLYAFDLTSTADFRLALNDTWIGLGEWDRADQQYVQVPVFAQ